MYINIYNKLYSYNGLRNNRIKNPNNIMNVTSGDCFNKGLIGHWKSIGNVSTGGTWNDISGNENNATLFNDAQVNNTGIVFDGSDYGIIPNSSLFSFGTTGSCSIQAWIKTTSATGCFASKRSIAGFNCYVYSGALYADGGGTAGVFSSIYFNTGVFKLGTIVYNRGAGFLQLYVNGVADNVVGFGAADMTDSANMNIGRSLSGDYFNGTIDDLRVYNRALSSQEVSEYYYKTKGYYTT